MWRKFDAYLVGYYGMHNTGDDALLLATMFGAQSELGCRSLCVASAADMDEEAFQQTKANLFHPQKFKGQNRCIHYYNASRSNRIIFGGGSVFHTASDINLKRQLMSLSNPAKSRALGVSLGPFADNAARQACKKFLEECGYVGVRDAHSYTLAKELAPEANVDHTFDLAALLKIHPSFATHDSARKGIVFNLCPAPLDAYGRTNHQIEERRITYICQTIYRVWEETKEPIALINLNDQEKGDAHISDVICAKLQNKVPIEIIPYCANPFYAIEAISRFKACVSMRLHGCILGYLSGTPTLALNYHTKCREWCHQIGMPSAYRFEANELQPQQLANTLIKGLADGFDLAQLPVLDAVQLSLKNWRTDYEYTKNFCRYSLIQQGSSYLRQPEKRI